MCMTTCSYINTFLSGNDGTSQLSSFFSFYHSTQLQNPYNPKLVKITQTQIFGTICPILYMFLNNPIIQSHSTCSWKLVGTYNWLQFATMHKIYICTNNVCDQKSHFTFEILQGGVLMNYICNPFFLNSPLAMMINQGKNFIH